MISVNMVFIGAEAKSEWGYTGGFFCSLKLGTEEIQKDTKLLSLKFIGSFF